MKIEELMSREVVTVSPDATLKEVAQLLSEHRISGLPVCDADGQVVGVVTEADILWKELGLEVGSDRLVDRLFERAYGVNGRVAAVTAGEAMTAPAITVPPDAPVARAAELMIDNGVNRLPVVQEGALVGIVTRADLVRAFTRSDEEIRREISDDVLLHTLWVDPVTVRVEVSGGRVTLSGSVENRATAEIIEHYVRRVPGVSSVSSELRWILDDRSRRTRSRADQLPRRV